METVVLHLKRLEGFTGPRERRVGVAEDVRAERRRNSSAYADCGDPLDDVGGRPLAISFAASSGIAAWARQRRARPSAMKPPPGPGALMPSGLSSRSAYGGVYS